MQHLNYILSNDDTLYQQIGTFGQLLTSDKPTYICICNCQFKVSEKQSIIDYIHNCNDEYCTIALANVHRIFDNSQHFILCLGDAAFTIMTMVNGTNYIFDPCSCYVIPEWQQSSCIAIFPSMRDFGMLCQQNN